MNNTKETKKITKIKKKKERRDSSDISSYDSDDDNITNEDIQKEARSNYVQNELLERITKYLKIDNTIKEKQKEIREYVKAMKTQKEDMEKYIIGYLNEVNEDFIKIEGEGKLTKTITTSKGAIKTDNIKSSVAAGLKKENITLDEKKFNELIGSILNMVEDNRPKKQRTYIKRTQVKKKEDKNEKNNDEKEKKPKVKKQIQPADSDEELPKYKS
jgi:hypothetical protein